ncbi:unnamed protein product [Meloidogyne enterolobii]|uniref:Uncharacterized protein n=1 Tax=Meloidogyne enterolobii TaxID=390850 RepID=A0ACB0YU61_MELEN
MSTHSNARNIGACSSSSQIQEEYIVVDDQHQQQRNQRILISSKLEEAVGGEYGQLNYQQQYSDDFEICDEIVVDAEDGEDGRVLVSVPAGSTTYDNYGQFAEDLFLDEQIHGKSSVRSMSAKRVRNFLSNLFDYYGHRVFNIEWSEHVDLDSFGKLWQWVSVVINPVSKKLIYNQKLGLVKKSLNQLIVISLISKIVKKGLENKELFRVPIYKGNTKYGAGYDRLVNFDGSTTDHYICKNYDQCGKIFHRRYLDALTTHMQTCRNKNLINPEECNANACKALVARLVVQEPTALTLLTSRFYLEFMEELSRIM